MLFDMLVAGEVQQEQRREVERLSNAKALLEFRCDAAEARAVALQAQAGEAERRCTQETASLTGLSYTRPALTLDRLKLKMLCSIDLHLGIGAQHSTPALFQIPEILLTEENKAQLHLCLPTSAAMAVRDDACLDALRTV